MRKIILAGIAALLLVIAVAARNKAIDIRKEQQTVSCYEYILQVMNEPQYWSEEDMPEYSTTDLQQEAKEALVNGTGWHLVDEESASFERGFQGILRIDFSTHTAVQTLQEEFNTADSFYEQQYYVADHTVYRYFPAKNQYMDLSAYYQYDETRDLYALNPLREIENTFVRYETKFASAGCPLLNQPSGTLSSYRQIAAVIPEETSVNDELIHAPWQQENWQFDWTKNTTVTWIDEYETLPDFIQTTEKEDVATVYDIQGKPKEVALYKPHFLLLTDPDTALFYQQKQSSNSHYFEQISSYDVKIGAFATYYIEPICRLIHNGDSAVFALDSRLLRDHTGSPFRYGMDFREFENATLNGNSNLLTLLSTPDTLQVGIVVYEESNNTKLFEISNYLDMVLQHHKLANPFASDYLLHFGLYYNLVWQRLLGLR